MVEAFVALGSNIGDRVGNIRKAIEFLKEKASVSNVSSMYETEPMYLVDQNWFVNCVAKLETNLSPRELLHYLKDVERRMGRTEGVRYGPRIIDLDILFYGDEVIRQDDLEIPHPGISERTFVLVPLAEIEPDLVHPVYGKTSSKLLAELNSNKSVTKLG